MRVKQQMTNQTKTKLNKKVTRKLTHMPAKLNHMPSTPSPEIHRTKLSNQVMPQEQCVTKLNCIEMCQDVSRCERNPGTNKLHTQKSNLNKRVMTQGRV